MSKNSSKIFDLKLLAGSSSNDIEIKKNTLTEINKEDQNTLLIGYELVDKNEWKNLQQATHIRYLRKDGLFRKGGYIKAIWNTDNNIRIDLVTNFNYNAISWSIYSNNVEKIWKKTSENIEHSIINNDLIELKEKIDDLDEITKILKIEIQKIINEQKRLIELIRKINKKIDIKR
jgi:hypothetical protein